VKSKNQSKWQEDFKEISENYESKFMMPKFDQVAVCAFYEEIRPQ